MNTETDTKVCLFRSIDVVAEVGDIEIYIQTGIKGPANRDNHTIKVKVFLDSLGRIIAVAEIIKTEAPALADTESCSEGNLHCVLFETKIVHVDLFLGWSFLLLLNSPVELRF